MLDYLDLSHSPCFEAWHTPYTDVKSSCCSLVLALGEPITEGFWQKSDTGPCCSPLLLHTVFNGRDSLLGGLCMQDLIQSTTCKGPGALCNRCRDDFGVFALVFVSHIRKTLLGNGYEYVEERSCNVPIT